MMWGVVNQTRVGVCHFHVGMAKFTIPHISMHSDFSLTEIEKHYVPSTSILDSDQKLIQFAALAFVYSTLIG